MDTELHAVACSVAVQQADLLPAKVFFYLLSHIACSGIPGEFGRTMVRTFARGSPAQIPMARPNQPDMPPKRTRKERLGIYRTQIRPNDLIL